MAPCMRYGLAERGPPCTAAGLPERRPAVWHEAFDGRFCREGFVPFRMRFSHITHYPQQAAAAGKVLCIFRSVSLYIIIYAGKPWEVKRRKKNEKNHEKSAWLYPCRTHDTFPGRMLFCGRRSDRGGGCRAGWHGSTGKRCARGDGAGRAEHRGCAGKRHGREDRQCGRNGYADQLKPASVKRRRGEQVCDRPDVPALNGTGCGTEFRSHGGGFHHHGGQSELYRAYRRGGDMV